MTDIIIPRHNPPQVATAVREKLANDMLAHGLWNLWDTALPVFSIKHRDLKDFVASFVFEQSGTLIEDERPRRAFRVGAVVAGLAYLQSGFDQNVEGDVFSLANLDAKLEGIPDVFVLSYAVDPELQNLVSLMLDTPEMQDGAELGSYEQILAIGAGCTRHYLQYAVAA